MQLHSIDTGFFKLDGGAMFGVVPQSMWKSLNPPDAANLCTWAMRLLLIEEGNRLILIDTGIGNKQSEKFFSHYHLHGDATLDASLRAKGFSRSDITDIILTHLHFDHCGGAIVRDGEGLVPAFPNATYWSNEAHWLWATQPNDREKASFLAENILPLQQSGQLRFVEAPIASEGRLGSSYFSEGISLRFVSGHTESMMLPQIEYKGRTIVYISDLLPSAAHLPIPYVMAYDTRPLLTLGEKKMFLDEAADGDYLLFFEHDPAVEMCSLQRTEKGVRMGEKMELEMLA